MENYLNLTLKLSDVLDMQELNTCIANKHINCRVHPLDNSFKIYDYSNLAYFSGLSTDSPKSIRVCRGLITRTINDIEYIINRPFEKFFNYEELVNNELKQIVDPWHPVSDFEYEISEKLDGSMGTMYYGPLGPAIATRGSFESDQAKHATVLLTKIYEAMSPSSQSYFRELITTYTIVCEIIYPENQIVVNYGDEDSITILGVINTLTGVVNTSDTAVFTSLKSLGFSINKCTHTSVGPASWRTIDVFKQYCESLSQQNEKNREGYVVKLWWTRRKERHFMMFKLKFKNYVELHKIKFMLCDRYLVEAWSNNTVQEIINAIPDEMFETVEKRLIEFYSYETQLRNEAYEKFISLSFSLGTGLGMLDPDFRKKLAIAINNSEDQFILENKGILFKIADRYKASLISDNIDGYKDAVDKLISNKVKQKFQSLERYN